MERYQVNDSPRAGGGYIIVDWKARLEIDSLTDPEKARLTTWLVDQRLQGNSQPEIAGAIVEYIKTKAPQPVHDRALRLLRFIAAEGLAVGERVWVDETIVGAYAWSESTNWNEVDYYLDYLQAIGWIKGDRISTELAVLW